MKNQETVKASWDFGNNKNIFSESIRNPKFIDFK
jgi:hypothetical protein